MRTTAPSSASSCAERSESWLPVTNTNGWPISATRATSAVSSGEPRSDRSPGKNTGPFPAARSRIGSEMTLLCRSEAIVTRGRPSTGVRPAGAVTSRARPTSCASSSWSSASPERRTGRPRRARAGCRRRRRSTAACRSRRAAGAGRRGRRRRERRDGRGGDRVAQLRAGAVADGERGEQAERERAERDDADQRAQVGGDRVARLGRGPCATSNAPPSATRCSASRSTVRTSTRRRAGSRIDSKRAPQSTSGT